MKILERKIEGLKRKITTHKHHKPILGILVLFCLFFVVVIPLYNVYSVEDSTVTQPVTHEVLGSESYGSVVKEGPYGNSSSPVKVAYILGEHPREWVAHKAVKEDIKENSDSLKYCYYLYIINVTQNANDFSSGRLNGQLLANKYVVDDIASGGFRLAIDVHGTDGEYAKKVFLFAPVQDESSLEIAYNLSHTLEGIPYYAPPTATSPSYTTTPLIKKGVPSIVYESFKDQPYHKVKEDNKKFIFGVDNLKLKANGCY